MTSPATAHCLPLLFIHILTLFFHRAACLTSDGILLLSFKYAVLTDPVGALDGWNYDDATPCSWNGVTCAGPDGEVSDDPTRVVSLALPGCRILGSLPPDLGLIQHLRRLDLSGNFLNGSLPLQLFNASELGLLNLADNELSGELPDLFARLPGLQTVNLSANAFAGVVPPSLAAVPNLTVISLSNNYLSGLLPPGFAKTQVLDFSSNLLNGSLNSNFTAAGAALRYLNLSANRLSGEIPPELGSRIPANATVDLSYNNFTGPVPDGGLLYQKASAFAGNVGLCGKPLRNPCSILSTLDLTPNVSGSPPALAAIPKNLPGDIPSPSAGSTVSNTSKSGEQQRGLKPGVIAGIVVGDMAGIGVLAAAFLYIYHLKKKKNNDKENAVISALKAAELGGGVGKASVSKTAEWSSPESGRAAWSCIGKIGRGGATGRAAAADQEESSTDTSGSGSDSEPENNAANRVPGGSLVSVDGETELELETLLKASAYILGATGASIVYKAVLADGTALAVRRIGDSGVGRFRDFENRVRVYAKLRHPNLVRIRGFYWGDDEKLVIYDYAANGSLANLTHKKMGSSSSPASLPWETRLRIAKGVARGLGYLHEKKHVHGNVKPGNILLGSDMEAMLGDYGLERLLISGESSSKTGGGSSRHFGSKRSTLSQSSLPDASTASPAQSSAATAATPYLAPESLKSLKPSPKWDVYSFGIILLELLTGRAFTDRELLQWNNPVLAGEDRNRVLRTVDCGLRGEVSEAREEALLACFRLGLSCAAVSPQRRPSMKEAVQILDKVPSSSNSNNTHY